MLKRIIILVGILAIANLNVFTENIEKKNYLKLGGAVRFNTAIENYEKSNKSLNTYAKFDAFILSGDAHQLGFDVSLQYRFYPESKTHFFRHAYIGYEIDKKWYAKIGIFQRPFGIGDYASNSFFFQLPYYIGLEDGNGIGLGAIYKHEKWTIDLAYFRQAAPAGSIKGEDNSVGNGRYAYAVVPTTGYINGKQVDANIRELDQFNGRIRYQLNEMVELGVSAQLGAIYNREIDKRKWSINWAAHLVYNYKKWNFKGEVVGYNFNSLGNAGEKLDILQMAAYGSAYDVSTKGIMYVAGLTYKIPINKRLIKSIHPYFDYSVADKTKKGHVATHQMVPGIMIKSGPIVTQVDLAMGKNQPWFTSSFGEGLGEGKKKARWNTRFNINIGYYF